MKVYQVTMGYYDGDHEHGQYRSPLFARREDAEAFAAAVKPTPENRPEEWWTDSFVPVEPFVSEHEVHDGPVTPREKSAYLCITYT